MLELFLALAINAQSITGAYWLLFWVGQVDEPVSHQQKGGLGRFELQSVI